MSPARLWPLSLCLLALCVAGCTTITRDVTDQVKLVRDCFNSLLPSDFSGPVDLRRTDMYMTVEIKAANVHKLPTGEWTWTSVQYHRTTSVPAFAGVTWKSDVSIVLGSP